MAKGGASSKSSVSQIAKAWRLYDAGDVASARAEATRALAKPGSPQEAEQARDLLRRTAIPKLGIGMAIAAGALVGLMVLLALVRG
jgi:hypothetical protein